MTWRHACMSRPQPQSPEPDNSTHSTHLCGHRLRTAPHPQIGIDDAPVVQQIPGRAAEGHGAHLQHVGTVGHLEGGARVLLYQQRSEEHTSELQSHSDLVCRLLLEKKKRKYAADNATNTG